ncbi:XRE family transcriptional regulator [Amycolatopsis sp., V23-08]|uniref:XRE family transcriptional regulator n=1 Tax=Amycolatopsis heterodermiae TaxID=3110235 RepID=A0ABU5R424_9PSEU|nr:helix-turn-helix domain-containing protein [Amycolatopsis sp., V23-08]MEA5360960.1 XRE family transcriptional regulator [Amycolatopsis sp., V23-08]
MPRAERPLDRDGSVLTQFAADLRKLREAAGGPSYRDLARLAHFSSTTLSDAAGGRRLPSLAVTLAYVTACDGDHVEWQRRWHLVSAELNNLELEHADQVATAAPYVGLAAYGPSDAERFFGRERLVDDLVARLRRQRFLAVFGPSGAGKSSVLRAGLVPALQAMEASGPVVLFSPGTHPVQEFALRLAPLVGTTTSVIEAELSGGPRVLPGLGNQLLLDRPSSAENVIVVDQFEEVFTLCADHEERAAFLDLLLAASSPGSRCRVVLGVRADFYAHVAQHEGLVTALRDAQVTVGPMTAEELRRVITRPATDSGCAVESDLLSVLIAHTHGQAGALPLLSHALRETWRRRKGNTLTLAGFQATGGLDGALVRTAETVFSGLTVPQQHLAQQLFKRLVVLGETTEDTKRRIPRAELDDDDDTAAVLQVLGDARLLTLDRETVEITHEALIGSWPRLQRWLNADREGHRIHRELAEGATDWEAHGRDPASLLRGNRLTLVADRMQPSEELTSRERAFLTASLSARDREQSASRRRIRRQRALIAALAVIALAASAMLVFALNAQHDATRQRNTALALRAAAAATDLLTRDPNLAAQIALAAYRLLPSRETEEAVISTAGMAHGSQLTQSRAKISDDSRMIISADGASHTTTIYRLGDKGIATTITVHNSGAPKDATLSPDGRLFAVPVTGNMMELWKLGTPGGHPVLASTLKGASEVRSWTPDGRFALIGNTPEYPPGPTGSPVAYPSSPVIWDLADPTVPVPGRTIDGDGTFVGNSHTLAMTPPLEAVDGVQAIELETFDRPQPTRRPWLAGDQNWSFMEMRFLHGGTTALLSQTTGVGKFAVVKWDVSNKEKPVRLGKFILPDGAFMRPEAASDLPPDRIVVTENGTLTVWDVADITHPKLVSTIVTDGTQGEAFRLTPDGTALLGVVILGGNTHTVVRWEFDLNKSAANVCASGDKFPLALWDQYFPELPYQPPC